MNTVLYWVLRVMVAAIQLLPLRFVVRLGRAMGAVVFVLGGRYRRVATENLELCFPEKSSEEIQAIARENFHRIFENYLAAIKTAAMSPEALRPHLEFIGADKILKFEQTVGPQSRIVAIGHFGNFELYARFGQYVPQFKCAATYRGLKQPALNRLLMSLRNRSGCQFFERRTDTEALKAAMNDTGLLLGLLADQHSIRGVQLPFFGKICAISTAPAILALRYDCPLHTAICYRTGLARWRVEAGDEIPTRIDGKPRPLGDIMLEVNQAFEKAIRRDPANWFWLHRRWKVPNRRTKLAKKVGSPQPETSP